MQTSTITSPSSSRPLRGRVLVMDDNKDITEALSLLLSVLDQEVRIANDAATALRIAGEFRPDLVFLDLGLPVMSGYDVARAMRAMPGGSATELVALSGWGDANARALSREAGFDHHWLKPIGLRELRQFFDTRGQVPVAACDSASTAP